ncbi:hypothetical protein KCP70_00280 [Salmonella enterica subsp. enterica]|nr:hypothetical protein KCP70_00280 [Salmonella enterica subsp. enterica]
MSDLPRKITGSEVGYSRKRKPAPPKRGWLKSNCSVAARIVLFNRNSQLTSGTIVQPVAGGRTPGLFYNSSSTGSTFPINRCSSFHVCSVASPVCRARTVRY